MNTEPGYLEGEICNRNGCSGTIEEREVEGCRCHLCAPCSACTEPREYCSACGWDSADEPDDPVVFEPPAKSRDLPVFRSPLLGIAADRQVTKHADGVSYTQTHSGQKRPYGGNHYDYRVTSELPIDEVLKICTEQVHKCSLSTERWRFEDKTDGTHFREHYTLIKDKSGEGYTYSVRYPSTF